MLIARRLKPPTHPRSRPEPPRDHSVGREGCSHPHPEEAGDEKDIDRRGRGRTWNRGARVTGHLNNCPPKMDVAGRGPMATGQKKGRTENGLVPIIV